MKIFNWLLIFSALELATSVRADLTAVVTPGYQFPTDGSVAPTYDLLNLLGNPSIQIYGTVGGSNTLAVGSVTGTQLSSSVADGATIGFNGNVPPSLRVLSAGIIGPGLESLSTTNMGLLVDTNYFDLATNTIANTNDTAASEWLTLQPLSLTDTNISPNAGIQSSKLNLGTNSVAWSGTNGMVTNLSTVNYFTNTLETNIYSGGTAVATLAPNWFVTAEQTVFNNDHTYSIAQSLGVAPRFLRWVLVCKATDNNYQPGMEVDLADTRENNTAGAHVQYGASTTNLFLVVNSANTWQILDYSTRNYSTLTPANWRLKCYYAR